MTYVIWTTRTDLVTNHWIPNHFIALLPIDIENNHNLETPVLSVTREQIGSVIKLGVVADNVQFVWSDQSR